MGELVINNSNEAKQIRVMETLPMSQQAFVMAVMATKLMEIEPLDAGKQIYQILKVAEMDSGLTKLHDDDIKVLAKSVYDLMKVNYRGLTVSEFRTACKNGVVGMYEDWYGFCLKTVVQWIEGYLTNDLRKRAIQEWNAKIDKELTSDKPLAAKIEFSKESALRAFEHYKLKGEMPLAPAAYYDLINEWIGEYYKGNKTLVTDPEARMAILEDVKSRFEKICLSQKKLSERNGNHNEAEKLINLVMDPKGNKTLERMTKEAFLKHFFNYLIESNTDLKL